MLVEQILQWNGQIDPSPNVNGTWLDLSQSVHENNAQMYFFSTVFKTVSRCLNNLSVAEIEDAFTLTILWLAQVDLFWWYGRACLLQMSQWPPHLICWANSEYGCCFHDYLDGFWAGSMLRFNLTNWEIWNCWKWVCSSCIYRPQESLWYKKQWHFTAEIREI